MDAPTRIPEEPERRGRVPAGVYWAYWAVLGLALLVAVVAFLFAMRNGRQVARVVAHNDARFLRKPFPQGTDSMFGRSSELRLRPLFPYSVIPGGVHSAQELKSAVAQDAVVASNYADFDLAKAHVIRLKRNRTAYVSYRLGDRIYWTKKKLTLVKGERIITDGKHEARTRCGNRIAETPSQPVSAQEPSEEAMESAPVLERFASGDPGLELPPIAPPAFAPPEQTPPEGPGGLDIPPPVFPIVGGDPLLPPPPSPPQPPVYPPPVATPEPNTLASLVTGVFACLSLGLRTRIRKKRKA